MGVCLLSSFLLLSTKMGPCVPVVFVTQCAIGVLEFERQKMFFLWLPMYWAYLNFNVWMIWASAIFLFFQKWLESFWFIVRLLAIFLHMGICVGQMLFRDCYVL